jgi:hypothetical protein
MNVKQRSSFEPTTAHRQFEVDSGCAHGYRNHDPNRCMKYCPRLGNPFPREDDCGIFVLFGSWIDGFHVVCIIINAALGRRCKLWKASGGYWLKSLGLRCSREDDAASWGATRYTRFRSALRNKMTLKRGWHRKLHRKRSENRDQNEKENDQQKESERRWKFTEKKPKKNKRETKKSKMNRTRAPGFRSLHCFVNAEFTKKQKVVTFCMRKPNKFQIPWSSRKQRTT